VVDSHLGQNISDHSPPGVHSDIRELGPCERMVQVYHASEGSPHPQRIQQGAECVQYLKV
jgi:hypothetical protein